MIIKRAETSDAKEILKLQKLAYRSEGKIYDDFTIAPLVQTLEELKGEFNDKIFLKAVLDEHIIGSVKAYQLDGTCYIKRLMVHPSYQNKGVGKELINRIEEMFPESRRFELYTGFKSLKNIDFYQKLGYKIFKSRKIDENIILVYLEKIVD